MITYKVKLIFENRGVYDFWVSQMNLVRDCYNFVSKIVFDEKVPLSLKVFHNRFYRTERDAFQQLPAQMCVRVYKQVLSNYKSVKSNRHKLTEPIRMNNPIIQLDKRLYSCLTRESFKLSSGVGNHRSIVSFLSYPKFEEYADKYKMCDPLLKYDEKSGKFYACIPFLTLPTTPHEDSYLGVDLGMKRIATLSNGVAYTDKHYLANRRKIRHNKKVLQQHKKHSHSARTKLKRLRRKEMNISKNMCYHIANEILKNDGSVIIMEDLNKIKQSTSKTKNGFKRTRHNNAISQVPFYQLRQILTYKALLKGKRVETVSPEYTSQEDCRIQSKIGCLRKGCRFFTADNLVFDADWNAAINISNRYKHSASFILPIDGRLNLVDRVCQQPNSELVYRPTCKLTDSSVRS